MVREGWIYDWRVIKENLGEKGYKKFFYEE